jgi:hypothetical protein
MTSPPQPRDGLRGFAPWERRFARDRLARWTAQQRTAHPKDDPEAVRRRALKLTYTNVAGLWLSIAAAPTFVAACAWTVADTPAVLVLAIALSAIAAGSLVMLGLRIIQANRWWPEHIAVTRRDRKLPPGTITSSSEGDIR